TTRQPTTQLSERDDKSLRPKIGDGTALRARSKTGRIVGDGFVLLRQEITLMSNAKDLLLPHLPYLRRYARALTGSQRRGDTYVAATIESILAEVALDELAANPKILLFRSFHDVWQLLAPPPVAEGGEPENGQVRTGKRPPAP